MRSLKLTTLLFYVTLAWGPLFIGAVMVALHWEFR